MTMSTRVLLALPFLLAAVAAPADDPARAPVIFRLYSDFTCPFCFIAERSLVERLVAEYDVVLEWRGLELHPEIPPGGLSLAEAFPGRDVVATHAVVRRFARSLGVDLP